MLRSWRVLRILTCKCAFRHSGVQFLISPLSTYLRTRRFNRPTFGLTRHTNLWKNTALRDFSNIWRGLIFFLLTFWLLHLLSTDLITLLLLFNSPYCRKFLFKLPSTTPYYKVLLQYYSVLLQYYKVLLQYYKVYSSTTKYYSSTTSSTAQGGGGSFKNRKRIGEIDCCEWRMSKQKHWPTD